MPITAPVKEAAVFAPAIAITFPHCSSGTTMDIGYNRDNIFSSV